MSLHPHDCNHVNLNCLHALSFAWAFWDDFFTGCRDTSQIQELMQKGHRNNLCQSWIQCLSYSINTVAADSTSLLHNATLELRGKSTEAKPQRKGLPASKAFLSLAFGMHQIRTPQRIVNNLLKSQ